MMDMPIAGTARAQPAAPSPAAAAQNTASQQIQADMPSLATGSGISVMA